MGPHIHTDGARVDHISDGGRRGAHEDGVSLDHGTNETVTKDGDEPETKHMLVRDL